MVTKLTRQDIFEQLEDDFLTESKTVTIDTSLFENTHGKKPKGRGQWVFAIKKNPSPKELDDPSITFQINESFGNAKRRAVLHFKPGERIFVQP